MERIEIRRAELIELVLEATELFYEENKSFFKLSLHEGVYQHRLAFYLQKEINKNKFGNYIVDCEYNKSLRKDKKIPDKKIPLEKLSKYIIDKLYEGKKSEKKTGKIRLDIIAHIRNSNNNLIHIELKKYSPRNKKYINADKYRLKFFTNPNNKIGICYELGVFVLIKKEKVELTFFESGSEIDKKIIF